MCEIDHVYRENEGNVFPPKIWYKHISKQSKNIKNNLDLSFRLIETTDFIHAINSNIDYFVDN